MKTLRYLFGVFFLFVYCSMLEAAFWGSFGSGYSSDDNFYKDVFGYNNTGYYYTFNLNAKSALSRDFSYDAFYILLGRKNYKITWEDNFVNNAGMSFTARPSDILSVRFSGSFENRTFRDEFSVKYNYNQYTAGMEVPLYILDYTTPKVGLSYENIKYNNFSYDSTAIGPLLELQQELSPWSIMTLSAKAMARNYPTQNLYEDVTTTTTVKRRDIELQSGIILSTIINRDWNFSAGIRYSDVRSNANLSVVDTSVEGSSRTLVADYYSFAGPSLFFETVFYPARKLGCVLGGTYQKKSYPGRYATDSAGQMPGETRKDERFIVSAGVTYRMLRFITLKAEYSYEKSSSNDYIYNYSNNIFSTGINVAF